MIALTILGSFVLLMFFGVIFFIAYSSRRRYRMAKEQGLDPWSADIQLMGQAQRSAWLASPESGSTVQERLRNLDALRAEGLISQVEWEQTRMDILKDL